MLEAACENAQSVMLDQVLLAAQCEEVQGVLSEARRPCPPERAPRNAENAGVRALLAHAMHLRAKAFYLHYGFEQSPVDPMPLMLRLPKSGKSER